MSGVRGKRGLERLPPATVVEGYILLYASSLAKGLNGRVAARYAGGIGAQVRVWVSGQLNDYMVMAVGSLRIARRTRGFRHYGGDHSGRGSHHSSNYNSAHCHPDNAPPGSLPSPADSHKGLDLAIRALPRSRGLGRPGRRSPRRTRHEAFLPGSSTRRTIAA